MLDIILGIFSSGGMGAIVGMAGSAFTKWIETKTLKQRLEYELARAEISIKELQLEHDNAVALADKQIDIAQTEGEMQNELASIQGFVQSQKENTVKYGGWVDKFRGMIRPVITLFLLGVLTAFTAMMYDRVGGMDGVDPETQMQIFMTLIGNISFLSVTAVAWWFGASPSRERKPSMK